MVLCMDSGSGYHLAVSLTRTQERRLQIDLHVLRLAYNNRDVTDIIWIHGDSNPADGLTKRGANVALSKLISTQHFKIATVSHIARDEVPARTDVFSNGQVPTTEKLRVS